MPEVKILRAKQGKPPVSKVLTAGERRSAVATIKREIVAAKKELKTISSDGKNTAKEIRQPLVEAQAVLKGAQSEQRRLAAMVEKELKAATKAHEKTLKEVGSATERRAAEKAFEATKKGFDAHLKAAVKAVSTAQATLAKTEKAVGKAIDAHVARLVKQEAEIDQRTENLQAKLQELLAAPVSTPSKLAA